MIYFGTPCTIWIIANAFFAASAQTHVNIHFYVQKNQTNVFYEMSFIPPKTYNHFYDVFLIVYSFEVETITTCVPGIWVAQP